MAEQGLASGCAVNLAGFSPHAGVMSNAQTGVNWKGRAVTLPALGHQKKVDKNNLRQGALPTQDTLP